MKKLQAHDMVDGIPIKNGKKTFSITPESQETPCDGCMKAKQKQKNFKNSSKKKNKQIKENCE